MTQNPQLTKAKKTGKPPRAGAPHFFWRKIGGEYLVTNDFGFHAWLGAPAFERFSKGLIGKKDKAFEELCSKGLVRNMMDFQGLADRWRSSNSHLASGPGLLILVMTLRCNHKCLYCQAGAVKLGVARALLKADGTLEKALRDKGLLTRDPRMKERKKYGRKGARKGFQFSKR